MQYNVIMTSYNYHQTVYWQLMQVMFGAKHSLNEIAEKYGLTTMQSGTLMALGEHKPVAMSSLSSQFMCDASSITGIADRLEAQGLVARQDHPTDRRIKLLAITPAGLALRDTIMGETVAAEAERLNPLLDETERSELQKLLQKILDGQTAH